VVVDPAQFGQYVLVETSILRELWSQTQCRNPACVHVQLDGEGIQQVGACLVGSFVCPKCDVQYTIRTDFNGGGFKAGPAINRLWGMMPMVCGQSPTQLRNGMLFVDVVQPCPTTTSVHQANQLEMITALGRDDACDDMLELAIKDLMLNPNKRKDADGNYH
jgi:hypothetical protein